MSDKKVTDMEDDDRTVVRSSVDWRPIVFPDQRPPPPEKKRSMMPAVMAVAGLAVVIGAGVAGYRWVNSPGVADETVAGPARSAPAAPAAASMAAPAAEPEVPAVPLNSTNTGEERPPSLSPAAEPAAPVAASETVPPVSVTAPPGLSAEDELWRAATAKDTQVAYQAYLKRYPHGKHADSAKVMLETKHSNNVAAAPAPAPAQTEPRASAAEPERKVAPAAASPGPTADRSPTQFAGSNAGGTSGGTQSRVPESAPSPPQVARTLPEPTTVDAAKKDIARAEPSAANAPSAQRSSGGAMTIKLAGQSMTGNFASDPATGIVSGTGQIVWDNGDRFEGRLVRGVKEGTGQFFWANGQRYSGDWAADMPNGRGILNFVGGNRYEGDVKNGEPHGHGTLRYTSGDVYTGSWANGKFHGPGKYTWANGEYWEGEYKDGKKTANGKTVFADGRMTEADRGTSGSAAPGTNR